MELTLAMRTVRIGHTPDMDDAFMFSAIANRRVPLNGLRVEHVIEDIQTLNRRAASAELDVTAISAASYPALADAYWILAVGSSVGRGYGPLLIARRPMGLASLEGRRIAVPGLRTTACLLLRLALPGGVLLERRFEEIPHAVQGGEVDAGLVIHEWQLTYRDAGLHLVLDLGAWWQQQMHLPLPLGLNVAKRSLGREAAGRIATLLAQSVRYALNHPEEALAYAMRYARGTDAARAMQFVSMYVNEDSLSLSPSCSEALGTLYARAYNAGLIPQVPALDIIEPA